MSESKRTIVISPVFNQSFPIDKGLDIFTEIAQPSLLQSPQLSLNKKKLESKIISPQNSISEQSSCKEKIRSQTPSISLQNHNINYTEIGKKFINDGSFSPMVNCQYPQMNTPQPQPKESGNLDSNKQEKSVLHQNEGLPSQIKKRIKEKFIQSFKQNIMRSILRKNVYKVINEKWENVQNQQFKFKNWYIYTLPISGIFFIVQLCLFCFGNSLNNSILTNIFRFFSLLIESQYKYHSGIILLLWVSEQLCFLLNQAIGYYILKTCFIFYLFHIISCHVNHSRYLFKTNILTVFKVKIIIKVFIVQHIFACLYQQLTANIFNIHISYLDSLIKVSFFTIHSNERLKMLLYLYYLFYIMEISYFLSYQIQDNQIDIHHLKPIKLLDISLKRYLYKNNISSQLRKSINNIFENAKSFNYDNINSHVEESFNFIPNHLKKQLFLQIRMKYLMSIKFLTNNFTKKFLEQLTEYIEEFNLTPGIIINKLCQCGMIMVQEGNLEILTHRGNNVVGQLNKGDIFGQEQLFSDVDIDFAVKTKSFCRVILIHRDKFRSTFENFQKDKERYFMLRDMNEKDRLSKLHIRCQICSQNHKTLKCNQYQYAPNKEKIIFQYIFADGQNRSKMERNIKKDYKSIMQLTFFQAKAKDIQNQYNLNIDEVSQGTSEYMEQLQSNSQTIQNQIESNDENKQSEDLCSVADFNKQTTKNMTSSQQMSETDKSSENLKLSIHRNAIPRSTQNTPQFNPNTDQYKKKIKEEQILAILSNQTMQLSHQISGSTQRVFESGSQFTSKTNAHSSNRVEHKCVQQNDQSQEQVSDNANNVHSSELQSSSLSASISQLPSSQNQIRGTNSNQKLTFRYDPTFTIQNSQISNKKITNMDHRGSISSEQVKNNSNKKMPSIIGTLEPDIQSPSQTNVKQSDEDIEQFKYVSSSNNNLKDRKNYLKYKSRTRTKSDGSKNSKRSRNLSNDTLGRSLRIKDEFDYLSKERRITCFEKMQCYENYFGFQNFECAINRYNTLNKKKTMRTVKLKYSPYFIESIRGQKLRQYLSNIQ